MKLNDVYTKPLKDVVEGLNLTDMKVHTDDDGEVRSIELKYEPNNRFTKGAQSCANVMTLKDKFNRWYDVYAEDIRDEARMEIRNLIDELE